MLVPFISFPVLSFFSLLLALQMPKYLNENFHSYFKSSSTIFQSHSVSSQSICSRPRKPHGLAKNRHPSLTPPVSLEKKLHQVPYAQQMTCFSHNLIQKIQHTSYHHFAQQYVSKDDYIFTSLCHCSNLAVPTSAIRTCFKTVRIFYGLLLG